MCRAAVVLGTTERITHNLTGAHTRREKLLPTAMERTLPWEPAGLPERRRRRRWQRVRERDGGGGTTTAPRTKGQAATTYYYYYYYYYSYIRDAEGPTLWYAHDETTTRQWFTIFIVAQLLLRPVRRLLHANPQVRKRQNKMWRPKKKSNRKSVRLCALICNFHTYLKKTRC